MIERDRAKKFKEKHSLVAAEHIVKSNMQSAQKAAVKAQKEEAIEKRLNNIIKEHT